MKVNEISTLNGAYQDKGLKVKHLSGESYVGLINHKNSLEKAGKAYDDGTTQLLKDFPGVEVRPTELPGVFVYKKKVKSKGEEMPDEWVDPPKDFMDKLAALKEQDFKVGPLNFIPANQLQPYLGDAEPNTVFVLSKYLLKGQKAEEAPKEENKKKVKS